MSKIEAYGSMKNIKTHTLESTRVLAEGSIYKSFFLTDALFVTIFYPTFAANTVYCSVIKQSWSSEKECSER